MLVFWDTNLFIYLLESHGDLTLLTRALWERMLLRGDRLVTSAMTLGELLSGTDPGRPEVALAARRWLDQFATIRSFDSEAAARYAAIRRDRTVRPPEAIQLACAAQSDARP